MALVSRNWRNSDTRKEKKKTKKSENNTEMNWTERKVTIEPARSKVGSNFDGQERDTHTHVGSELHRTNGGWKERKRKCFLLLFFYSYSLEMTAAAAMMMTIIIISSSFPFSGPPPLLLPLLLEVDPSVCLSATSTCLFSFSLSLHHPFFSFKECLPSEKKKKRGSYFRLLLPEQITISLEYKYNIQPAQMDDWMETQQYLEDRLELLVIILMLIVDTIWIDSNYQRQSCDLEWQLRHEA